jgi:integrase
MTKQHNAKRRFIKYAKGYVYFRLPSGKLIPLPTDESSVEFERAYQACLAKRDAAPAPVARVANMPDSVSAAIQIYLSSPGFLKLRDSTKARQRRHCERMREEIGTGRLKDLNTRAIDIYSEQVERQYGASVADRYVFVISKIWQNVKKYEQFDIWEMANPTREARKAYEVQQAHRAWTDDVQERFMAAAPAQLQLAKLLLHFSAQRGGDCVKMLWSDYDGEGITVRQEKLHGERDAEPDYYLCPKPLREALDAAPRTAETILTNAYGQRYADASVLSKAIKRQLIRVGLARKGERTFVMHGLRKTAAKDVAPLGVGAGGIKSITGHRTDQEANYYAQGFERKRVNRAVVEAWDAELERKEREREIEQRRAQIHRVA